MRILGWLMPFVFGFASMNTAFAQELPSRLRFEPPAGWTPSVDGKSWLPPGGNAVLTLAPSTPFDGTAGQWMETTWNDVARELKVVSGPAPGTQGAFLSRIGLFQQANGTEFWLCLNTLVKDGRGESVILIAGNDAQFRAHLPALSRMLAGTTVATASSSAAAPLVANTSSQPSASAPSAVSASPGGVAGLYLASTSQYRLNPLGGPGSGSIEWRTEFYLLSRDGRVFRGPDLPRAPDGDIARFDFDAARREAPAASGTYVVRGNEVVLTMGESPRETIVAARPEPAVLEIRGTRFRRKSGQ